MPTIERVAIKALRIQGEIGAIQQVLIENPRFTSITTATIDCVIELVNGSTYRIPVTVDVVFKNPRVEI